MYGCYCYCWCTLKLLEVFFIGLIVLSSMMMAAEGVRGTNNGYKVFVIMMTIITVILILVIILVTILMI